MKKAAESRGNSALIQLSVRLEKIILVLKALGGLHDKHRAQVHNDLKATLCLADAGIPRARLTTPLIVKWATEFNLAQITIETLCPRLPGLT